MTRFTPLVLKLAAAAMTMALAGVGLAAAGAGLPGLPGHTGKGTSRARSSSHASDVQSVIDSTPPSERGCEFGHAVATAARGSELPSQAQAACNHSGKPENRSSRSRGRKTVTVESSAGRQFGQDTAERAKSLGTAPPEQRQQFGQQTSQGAQQLGAQPDQRPAPQGSPTTGETQSQAGRATGEQAAGAHGP